MANFSDLLLKLANNAKLTPQELDELGRFGTETQQRNAKIAGWVSGVEKLNVQSIKAQDVFFERMPNSFMVLEKNLDTTISNNAFESILNYQTFTPFTGDVVSTSNDFFELDSSNGRIYMKQANRVVGFYIFNVWESNGTGNRSARVYQYNKDGTELGYSVVYRLPAVSGNTTSVNGTIFVPWGGERNIGDYALLKVYQNSGADLNLSVCAFGTFIIR